MIIKRKRLCMIRSRNGVYHFNFTRPNFNNSSTLIKALLTLSIPFLKLYLLPALKKKERAKRLLKWTLFLKKKKTCTESIWFLCNCEPLMVQFLDLDMQVLLRKVLNYKFHFPKHLKKSSFNRLNENSLCYQCHIYSYIYTFLFIYVAWIF